jgi:protein-serine/threonine kinase
MYVLKVVSKTKALKLRQEKAVIAEAEILATLSHPFIVKLYGRFQTRDDLVFVMENVCNGAVDLWKLLYEDVPGRGEEI